MLPLASTSNRVTGVSVCVVPAPDEPRVTAIRLPLSSSSVIRSPSPSATTVYVWPLVRLPRWVPEVV